MSGGAHVIFYCLCNEKRLLLHREVKHMRCTSGPGTNPNLFFFFFFLGWVSQPTTSSLSPLTALVVPVRNPTSDKSTARPDLTLIYNPIHTHFQVQYKRMHSKLFSLLTCSLLRYQWLLQWVIYLWYEMANIETFPHHGLPHRHHGWMCKIIFSITAKPLFPLSSD